MGNTPSLRLVTIGPSHYCEKARWALDRAGARYVEERHVPLAHWFATARARGRRTVPVLVTPHGTLSDSTDILKHLDGWLDEPARLYPHEERARREVAELEDTFDQRLGPATRRVAYFHVMKDIALFRDLLAAGVPRAEEVVFRAAAPAVLALMKRGMRIDEEGARRSRVVIDEVFGDVARRLEDGRRYLTGDRFTAADLAFATLAAPVLLPQEYGPGFPDLARLAEPFAREVDTLRATRAGAFALRLFADERPRRPSV